MSQLEFYHVSKRFGAVSAVENFSLTVKEGAFVSLLGPAKSGKTTLLRLAAGLEAPDRGTVCLDGCPIDLEPTPAIRNEVRLVFSDSALWPHMTVFQNVAFGLQNRGLPKKEILSRTEWALKCLNAGDIAKARPGDLTPTQCRRIALARALAGGARTILLDGLGDGQGDGQDAAFRGDLKRLHQELGLTILLATRDQQEALSMAQTVILLENGRLRHTGSPLELYLNPVDLYVAQKIGTPAINLVAGKAQVEGGLLTVQSILGIAQFGEETFTEATRPNRLFDCLVGFRPEMAELSFTPRPGAYEARVYSCQPSGSETVVQVSFEGKVLLVKLLGPRIYEPDQTVWLTVAPECMNVFDAHSGMLIKRATDPVVV